MNKAILKLTTALFATLLTLSICCASVYSLTIVPGLEPAGVTATETADAFQKTEHSVIYANPEDDLQEIIYGLKAGDTLYLHSGTYDQPLYLGPEICGTSDAHIVISSAPGETAILSGKGKRRTLLTMDGCSYIDIQNLTFCDCSGNESCGILVESGTSHFAISGNSFYNITCRGRNSANAILLFGESPKAAISYGLITGNKASKCATGWGEAISITGNVHHVDTTYNTVRRTGNIGIDYSGNYGYCSDPATDFPRFCKVQGNLVTDCHSTYATCYGIYVDGGQHITIAENTVLRCDGGIEIGAEEKPPKYRYSTRYINVINNTVKNNSENGITIGGYDTNLGWVRDVTVSGNICLDSGTSLTLSKCDNITITGNRFTGTSRADAVYSEMGEKYTKHIIFKSNRFERRKK